MHNWIHGDSRLCKGAELLPAKRGKLEEELEDRRPLALRWSAAGYNTAADAVAG